MLNSRFALLTFTMPKSEIIWCDRRASKAQTICSSVRRKPVEICQALSKKLAVTCSIIQTVWHRYPSVHSSLDCCVSSLFSTKSCHLLCLAASNLGFVTDWSVADGPPSNIDLISGINFLMYSILIATYFHHNVSINS